MSIDEVGLLVWIIIGSIAGVGLAYWADARERKP